MDFDYSEREWTIRGHVYASRAKVNAWAFARYTEKLQEATQKSPLGANLPPKLSAKYESALSEAMQVFVEEYPDIHSFIVCEAILRPRNGSPPFEEVRKELDMFQEVIELAPVVAFFFESAAANLPSAESLPSTGKASKAIRKGSRSVTTSR